MNRRNFLKSLTALAAVSQAPKLLAGPATTPDKITIRTGLPPIGLRKLNEGNIPTGELQGLWTYRGWSVAQQGEKLAYVSDKPVRVYEAYKGDLYIHCEIDNDLIYGIEKDYVNSELDAYIDQSNMILSRSKDIYQIGETSTESYGSAFDHVWKGKYNGPA